MVIISAVLCDKNGILLLGRQFSAITINELKEHVRNFPKLISPTQQHTFIDLENIRYIYTPVDELYIMLMTTKHSNIIEDLEVLRILKCVITEICNSITPETVNNNSFEILLSIDDIISAGLRESTTIAQVQTALEMESSEEKLHNLLNKARENEAKEQAKKFQLEMERKRQEEQATKKLSGKKQVATNAFTLPQNDPFNEPNIPQKKEEIQEQFNSATQVLQKNVKQAPKKGMQLGKKKEVNVFDE